MPGGWSLKKPMSGKSAPKFPLAMPRQRECFLERCFFDFDNGKKSMVYANATWTYLPKGENVDKMSSQLKRTGKNCGREGPQKIEVFSIKKGEGGLACR